MNILQPGDGLPDPRALFEEVGDPQTASVVVIPVPWEATTSYRGGTARGPTSIFRASFQVDLYHEDAPDISTRDIVMLDIPAWIAELSDKLVEGRRETQSGAYAPDYLKAVNAASTQVLSWVREQAEAILARNQLPVVLGGDHSSPLGLIQALGARYDDFGILQVDAHCDLRIAYEGFTYSHASIMDHALNVSSVKKLVQLGIRDYAHEEAERARDDDRIELFAWRALARERFQGKTWSEQVAEILPHLPRRIYLSFDIDGLDPALCPHTGTPVPGGFQFDEAVYLIERLRASGRRIVGADLCEVAPGPTGNDWDSIVGAQLLYQLFVLLADQDETA